MSVIGFKTMFVVRKLDARDSEIVRELNTYAEQVAAYNQVRIIHSPEECNEETLIVVLGGDGTMLAGLRVAAIHGGTVMGVNLGKVGFLTDFTPHRFRSVLPSVFDEKATPLPIEERKLITATIGDQSIIACNEISISGKESDSMVRYSLNFNGAAAGMHRANSILIATPTGSTAYSLSAGGGLMFPTTDAMQVVPVAPVTLTSRPIIVGSDIEVEVQVTDSDVSIKSDGTSIDLTNIERPLEVRLRLDQTAKIMHERNWNFFDVLSMKLGWLKE